MTDLHRPMFKLVKLIIAESTNVMVSEHRIILIPKLENLVEIEDGIDIFFQCAVISVLIYFVQSSVVGETDI